MLSAPGWAAGGKVSAHGGSERGILERMLDKLNGCQTLRLFFYRTAGAKLEPSQNLPQEGERIEKTK